MRILVQLSHPAHFHYYRIAIQNWQKDGHEVLVLIKTKDILEDLVKNANIPYININSKAHRSSKFGVFWDMLLRDWHILKICLKKKIDILTGSTAEIAQIGWLLRKPAICTGEDDADAVPAFVKFTAPFLKVRLTPVSCNSGKMEPKTIKYASYHELAYLHPNHFQADKSVVERYFPADSPYFILRFASLKAHHDTGIKGINAEIAQKLIDILKPHGRIYITSERQLEPQFEQYRIKINPLDIHHVMAFASLYIGDSQTMAAEAAVLGVPFIRYNDFVGRIGYLNELENDYHLGFGIKASEKGSADKMYKTLEDLLSMPNLKEEWQIRRQHMLSEKIDYAKFLTWFIENYPESQEIMRKNPEYQNKFR